MKYKSCTKCGKNLPATPYYFYRNSVNKTDGLRPDCKECNHNLNQEYYKKNSLKIREKAKITGKIYRQKNKDIISQKNKEFRIKAREKSESKFNYRGIHKYITDHKEKPKYCNICNEKEKLQLASIDHKYLKDLKDWLYLCQSCHIKFDKCRKLLLKYFEIKKWIISSPLKIQLEEI